MIIRSSLKTSLSNNVPDSHGNSAVKRRKYFSNTHGDHVCGRNLSEMENTGNIRKRELNYEWTGAKVLKLTSGKWVSQLHRSRDILT